MYPTPFTVEHHRQIRSGENALGQPTVEWQSITRAVIGWRHKSTSDGGTAVLDGRVINDSVLLTVDADWFDGDRVTLPGQGDFVIVGDAEDSNHSPFAPGVTFGYRLTLRKITNGPA